MPRAAQNAPLLPPAATPARGDASFEEQKNSFLRVMSHELRTPLNSILGFSDLLSQELYGPLGDPHYKEYAEIIRHSGGKLLRMVNQVLELARLQGGVHDLALGAEPVEGALDAARTLLAEEIGERDIQLTIEPCAEILVLADPKGLRTVLGNLLQNAVAFSPDGGEVRVACRPADGWVEVEVADRGEGVDPADLARLVKPFEQGGNTLTRSGEGAGLGLAIVDLTCQAMGGTLALNSSPGQGMIATVRLRAA